jgi:hypothetical protein
MGVMPRNKQRWTSTTSLSTVCQPAATRVGFGPRLGNATLSTGEGSRPRTRPRLALALSTPNPGMHYLNNDTAQ